MSEINRNNIEFLSAGFNALSALPALAYFSTRSSIRNSVLGILAGGMGVGLCSELYLNGYDVDLKIAPRWELIGKKEEQTQNDRSLIFIDPPSIPQDKNISSYDHVNVKIPDVLNSGLDGQISSLEGSSSDFFGNFSVVTGGINQDDAESMCLTALSEQSRFYEEKAADEDEPECISIIRTNSVRDGKPEDCLGFANIKEGDDFLVFLALGSPDDHKQRFIVDWDYDDKKLKDETWTFSVDSSGVQNFAFEMQDVAEGSGFIVVYLKKGFKKEEVCSRHFLVGQK